MTSLGAVADSLVRATPARARMARAGPTATAGPAGPAATAGSVPALPAGGGATADAAGDADAPSPPLWEGADPGVDVAAPAAAGGGRPVTPAPPGAASAAAVRASAAATPADDETLSSSPFLEAETEAAGEGSPPGKVPVGCGADERAGAESASLVTAGRDGPAVTPGAGAEGTGEDSAVGIVEPGA